MSSKNNSFFQIPEKQKPTTDITWKIGGEAGWGIKSAGLNLSKAFARGGYHLFCYDEYPSLVRGGHNCYQARISAEKIYSQVKAIDILVALNKETFELHQQELKPDAFVIYDGNAFNLQNSSSKRLQLINIPFREITKQQNAPAVMMNNAALGATIALVDFDLAILNSIISDQFGHKGQEIVDLNQKVAQAGYDHLKQNYPQLNTPSLKPRQGAPQMITTGNEAIAMGAVAGGLKFYPAYPMTPASSILHSLAAWAQEQGIVVVQTEDEISAINMAIGGAYAGVRSMTATSGGGFCLMTEGLGLAGITETPVVIVVAQRPGPATGIPTWTEQGDLRFAIHAHQGSIPRVVIAPGDLAEAFTCTVEALNIAEKYQLPVILLSDKILSESHASTKPFDQLPARIERGDLVSDQVFTNGNKYERYSFTDNGVSPRAFPGYPGIVVRANSDEHDPLGFSTEDSETRIKMMDKRAKKLETLAGELPQPKLYGPETAELTLIGWGTTKGAILEAQKDLLEAGISTNFLHYIYLHPFPVKATKNSLNNAKKTLCVENSFDAALAGLIRQHTSIEVKERLLKYDGRPVYPDEIEKKVKMIL